VVRRVLPPFFAGSVHHLEIPGCIHLAPEVMLPFRKQVLRSLFVSETIIGKSLNYHETLMTLSMVSTPDMAKATRDLSSVHTAVHT
jgi:creatinine amidohydrolase/Fe(II)-dependent formamide hydrolase-like protein